jgi:protein TonB
MGQSPTTLSHEQKNKEIAMHFSDSAHASGSKLTKLGIVAVLHVALGAALIQSMSTIVHIVPPSIIDTFPVPPLTPPPEPPSPINLPTVAPPTIVTPQVEVLVEQTLEPLVRSVTESDTTVPVEALPPGPVVPEQPQPAARPAKIYNAVLANADACVTPDYPSRSARNGHTGEVTLALLVGVNGQVADARVTRSSGYRELDRAAIAALRLCEFKPASNNGAPEAAWAQIAYVWRLD